MGIGEKDEHIIDEVEGEDIRLGQKYRGMPRYSCCAKSKLTKISVSTEPRPKSFVGLI